MEMSPGGRSFPGLDLGAGTLLSVSIGASVRLGLGAAPTVAGVLQSVCSKSYAPDPVLVQNVWPGRRWRFEQRVGAGARLWERYHISNGRRLAEDGHQSVESCFRNSVWFVFCVVSAWTRCGGEDLRGPPNRHKGVARAVIREPWVQSCRERGRGG